MLEQLRKSWAIKEKRTSLEELIKKRDEFNERVNQLREALDEATAKEDIDKINEDISALEAEKGETDYDAEVDKLNGEIEQLERELDEINDKAKQPATAAPATERKTERMTTMNHRSIFYKLSEERQQAFIQNSEVREFLDGFRARLNRSVVNGEINIPEVMLSMVSENIDSYSKLLPLFKVETLSGDGIIPIAGVAPEAIWVEATADFKEVDINFMETRLGNNKVTAYCDVPNSWIEDSDIDLAAHIIDMLGKGIGKALDHAFIYGTGNYMPLGVVTRLAQTVKPENWNAKDVTWKDLHTSNILKYDLASKSGKEFFKAITQVVGLLDDTYTNGDLVWCMSNRTKMDIISNAIAFDSSAVIASKVNDEMPIVGGKIEKLSCLAYGDIVVGYRDMYVVGERKGIALGQSEHAKFVNDKTVFAAKARYDGKPILGESFAIFNINNAAPTTTSTFPGVE